MAHVDRSLHLSEILSWMSDPTDCRIIYGINTSTFVALSQTRCTLNETKREHVQGKDIQPSNEFMNNLRAHMWIMLATCIVVTTNTWTHWQSPNRAVNQTSSPQCAPSKRSSESYRKPTDLKLASFTTQIILWDGIQPSDNVIKSIIAYTPGVLLSKYHQ